MHGAPREGDAHGGALLRRRDCGGNCEKEPACFGRDQLDAAHGAMIEDLSDAAIEYDAIPARRPIGADERYFFRPHAGRPLDACPRVDERRLYDIRTADEV